MGPAVRPPLAPPAVARGTTGRPGAPAAVPLRLGDLLAPPRPHASALVRPADVGGRAAWDVLVRDGALRVLWSDAAVPSGTTVAPLQRASALGPDVPAGVVVAGRTAAWVHTGAPGDDGPVAHLDLCYPTGRHRPRPRGDGRVWQASLLRDDTMQVGPVRVTSPLRTVVDLALHAPPDEAVTLVRVVAARCAVEPGAARRELERRARVVGRPRARRVLAAAFATVSSTGPRPALD